MSADNYTALWLNILGPFDCLALSQRMTNIVHVKCVVIRRKPCVFYAVTYRSGYAPFKNPQFSCLTRI